MKKYDIIENSEVGLYIKQTDDGDFYDVKEVDTEIDRLKSLIDGAKVIIEIWDAKSPAQKEWKKEWLINAKEILNTEIPTPEQVLDNRRWDLMVED